MKKYLLLGFLITSSFQLYSSELDFLYDYGILKCGQACMDAISGDYQKVKIFLDSSDCDVDSDEIIESMATLGCLKQLFKNGVKPNSASFRFRLTETITNRVKEDEKNQEKFRKEKEVLKAFLVTNDFSNGLSAQTVREEQQRTTDYYKKHNNYTAEKQKLLSTVVNEILMSTGSSEK